MPDRKDVCIITESILYQEDLCGHQLERRQIKHSLILEGGHST